MQQTLHQHIVGLEERIQALRDELTNPSRIRPEIERIQAEIRVAELALRHYRAAVALEQHSNIPAEPERRQG